MTITYVKIKRIYDVDNNSSYLSKVKRIPFFYSWSCYLYRFFRSTNLHFLAVVKQQSFGRNYL